MDVFETQCISLISIDLHDSTYIGLIPRSCQFIIKINLT